MTFKSIELETLEADAPANTHLRAIELGVTSRCNFRCDYCGAYDLAERRILSLDQVKRIVDDTAGLERVKLSGGEVLLEFDLCADIIEYCTSKNIHTQVNTNGTLLDAERITRLEDAGLGVLHFSLNHTNAMSHAAFYRVVEKLFGRIVRSIELSAASSTIDTVVETILFDETENTLSEVNLFAAGLGVRKHEIQMEIPSVHQGYSNTLNHRRIAEAIGRLVNERSPDCTIFFSCLSAYFTPGSEEWGLIKPYFATPGIVYSNCIEGKSQLHLHSNGDVMICELGCPEIIGNVFDKNLIELYQTSKRLQEFIQAKHDEESFTCFRHLDAQPKSPKEKAATLLGMPQLRT